MIWQWHKFKDEQPKPSLFIQEYLTARKITDVVVYEVVLWANNLRKTGIPEFDLKECERGGFYTYNDELMAYEVTVDAWTEIKEYK